MFSVFAMNETWQYKPLVVSGENQSVHVVFLDSLIIYKMKAVENIIFVL